MTIMGALHHIDVIKPNSYSQVEKIKWLSNLDGAVKAEIIDTHEVKEGENVTFNGYDENTDLSRELLVPHPYDVVYISWLQAQIDYANGEYGKYNNSINIYNTEYSAFEKYYNRTHKPISKNFTHF